MLTREEPATKPASVCARQSRPDAGMRFFPGRQMNPKCLEAPSVGPQKALEIFREKLDNAQQKCGFF